MADMTDDPFELFRQSVSQFSSTTSGFDPREFGALGWPMTPFPMPGAGTENPLSPEAGTKQAITQLYSAMAELDEKQFGADSAPMDFWEQYVDMMPGSFPDDAPDRVGSMMLGTYLVWLNSLSQLLVESYTVRFLSKEIVEEDHRNAIGTEEWLWQLSQPNKEQLLLRCTDVEDELVEEMEAARERRNELLLSFGNWDEVTMEDPLGDAKRYLHVLNGLEERVAESSYEFFPESS